jgi:hypothetical protein
MKLRPVRLLVLLAALAAGCSALTPYATAPLPATNGVTDPGPRVAICYNRLKTSSDQVQQLAQAECLGDTVAQQVDTDYYLQNCPLSVPGRATFVCAPKK